MELNNNAKQTDDCDRLSGLIDDILLSILGKVDIFTIARTRVLSKRWRHLPRLLPEVNLHVKDFLCIPHPDPIEARHIDQAMSSLTKAARFFLVNPQSECSSMKKLSLKLYITSNHWFDIGLLVNNAIGGNMVKELVLDIIDEKDAAHAKDRYMRRRARNVNGLFSAYPTMYRCLTKLCLVNVRFADLEMHHLLFDCCKQLQHLYLDHCDNGDGSVWKINAPHSKLIVLEVYTPHFERLEVLCLPKLEQFQCDTWFNYGAPVHFGSIPSLKKLHLKCAASIDHREICLSEVLGATNIHTLILDFEGEKVWMQPEVKQLWATFTNLRNLSLHGIYVEFDLLWTTVLLEAATSIEIFDIKIYEHPCAMHEGRMLTWGEQPTKPSWEIPRDKHCKKWKLKELQIVGFRPIEQQMSFITAIMEQAQNLKTILLKEEDEESCEDCKAMNTRPHVRGTFPSDKDEQEGMVRRLRDNVSSFAEIIFGS